MASFTTLSLSKKQVKDDLKALEAMLDDPRKPSLGEKKDIWPFFNSRPHICAFMGTYNPNIIDYRKISYACEFDIFGDHTADVAVGDMANDEYCFIEFRRCNRDERLQEDPQADAGMVVPIRAWLQPTRRLDSLDREQQGEFSVRKSVQCPLNPLQHAARYRKR